MQNSFQEAHCSLDGLFVNEQRLHIKAWLYILNLSRGPGAATGPHCNKGQEREHCDHAKEWKSPRGHTGIFLGRCLNECWLLRIVLTRDLGCARVSADHFDWC